MLFDFPIFQAFNLLSGLFQGTSLMSQFSGMTPPLGEKLFKPTIEANEIRISCGVSRKVPIPIPKVVRVGEFDLSPIIPGMKGIMG